MPLFQVDAFTDVPFSGNPAAVYVAPAFPADTWMQNLAAEMNLSETAFLEPVSPGTDPARYNLRWFTPTHEVDLCGHATLAAAHAIWAAQAAAANGEASGPDAILFETASGRMKATRDEKRSIVLDFPADPPNESDVPAGLLDALGITDTVFTGRGDRDILIQLSDPDAVRSLAPDMTTLATFDTRGVVVTAPTDRALAKHGETSEPDADFVSRFFGPAVGVPEDPVTGSAHCSLGPYWAKRLGRKVLTGRQVSSRGGTVGVDVRNKGRVLLSGTAVTIFRGELRVGNGELRVEN